MITVYGRADSTNVQKVLWLFGELDIAFERIDRGGRFGGLDDADYRALNPNGQIPTVIDGEVVMWESNAILRHYTRLHARTTLFPVAPLDMLRADMLLDWNTNQFWPALRPAYFGLRREGKTANDPTVIASIAETKDVLAILNGLLFARPYAAGDTFSIADIPIAISTDRWLGLEKSLDPYPAVAEWHRRVAARPAYSAHVFS